MSGDERVVKLDPALALRDHFLGWQCRIRQHQVRAERGRPSAGMRPRLRHPDGSLIAEAITVLILPREPRETIYQFRHLARRTDDPAERFAKIVETLASAHFQRPREFSDEMTALFGPDSQIAAAALEAGRCVLDFAQHRQSYTVPCTVSELNEEAPAWQATYWHNLLFNPALPPDVRILAFTPRWSQASAEPPVTAR